MSSYNNWDSEEEAQKWAAGVIAGLLSFGALATRISEIETEDKKIDTPEIESPDISVPSVNMNLGKNFGLSNIPADKLITIIFSLLMIIFIILSTIKGVRIDRQKIVKDLLNGKFTFNLSVNGPTKFYLMGEDGKDYTLLSATSGYVKYIPGLVAPIIDDTMQYLHAKNNGLDCMHLNAYFLPSNEDYSVISNGRWGSHHIDEGDYELQLGSFGGSTTEHVSVTDFEPEILSDDSYGKFEFAPKRWYSNSVNGAFFLRYYNTDPNRLSNTITGTNVSFMLPITGVDIEYRPYEKDIYGTDDYNLCIFKTITLESEQGKIQITNNIYPEGGDECTVRFNSDYSKLFFAHQTAQDSGRYLRFQGYYHNYSVEDNHNVPSSNITVKYNYTYTMLQKTMPTSLPAFSCGTGDEFIFSGTAAQGYSSGTTLKYVHLGLIESVNGDVDEHTESYFRNIYNPNHVDYYGEGYSDINGIFVDVNAIDTLRENPSIVMNNTNPTADYSLGYTSVSFTSNPYEKGKPVHKVVLRNLRHENDEYTVQGVQTYYYEDNGNEKIWSLYTDNINTSAHFKVNLELDHQIPTSGIRQDEVWYPLKSSLNYIRIDARERDDVHSEIHDLKTGTKTESIYRLMTIGETSPKTDYEQQKSNDYIRAANVQGTTVLDIEYGVETVDTNPHTDFNIASPCTVEVEVPDCYTDPPPKYSEGLDKARAELRCDEMYLVQIFGTDYMNVKTNDMSFAESYVPDCECGKTDRFFERY